MKPALLALALLVSVGAHAVMLLVLNKLDATLSCDQGDLAYSSEAITSRNASPHVASTFSEASSSPRVGPMLTMAIGIPRSAACFTNRKPDHTVSDEPTTSRASALLTAAIEVATFSRGTDSPKNTTAGLSTPPQRRHGGRWKSPLGS